MLLLKNEVPKNRIRMVLSQKVQSTNIVECRVSILVITIVIWGSIPHNST